MKKSIFSPEHEKLCDLLKQMRLGAGLRQEEMADALGRPQSFVSRYESGDRRLDLLELRQICQVLGISLGEFLARFERLLQ